MIENDVELSKYVAYKIGGPAKYFIVPNTLEEIRESVRFAQEKSIPFHVIGSGTNLLVRDGGIDGLVIYMGPNKKVQPKLIEDASDFVRVEVSANMSKFDLLFWAINLGYSGLEFSAGIPGTLGGGVYMNAGTKWGAYEQVIESVLLYNSSKGFFKKTNEEMGFKYRGHGEGSLDSTTLVCSLIIKLKKGVSQSEIRKQVDQIYAERGLKQPLECPNCGSVFKNPIGSSKGAGRLIEASGLKGFQIGKAQVSLKHANFILNLGGAKSSDVENLIAHIQDKVFKDHGVQLEREVIFLGKN